MLKELFKITSAGSVDDGKSTILARLLLDTNSIYDDQIPTNLDPTRIADLLDGLESEQSQGITIDIAHRFFDSAQRRYQIADSPGHEQYTRNMATACAGSDALMLVIDATVGLKPQSLHHLEIALRLGIKQVVFAINKMDLVKYSHKRFLEIDESIESHIKSHYGKKANFHHQSLPVSGLSGANVVRASRNLKWFSGPTLLQALESLRKPRIQTKDTIVSVQDTQRIAGGGRRYLGKVLQGTVSCNQVLFAVGIKAKIATIFAGGEEKREVGPGAAFTFELGSDLDLGRGEFLSSKELPANNQYETDIIWLSKNSGSTGERYLLKVGPLEANALITKIVELDLASNTKSKATKEVVANQIVRMQLSLSKHLPLQAFDENFTLGRFILVSSTSGETVAVGTVKFGLRRGLNVKRQQYKIGNNEHAQLLGSSPRTIWFTGLSGSGKSSVADRVSQALQESQIPHYVLDGDNLRLGLSKDLGFSSADRKENVRRAAEVAKILNESGVSVLVTLITPTEDDRALARSILGDEVFRLVYMDIPIEICESRDPKGLYKKARAGEIPNFTGIGSAYERPTEADLELAPLTIEVQSAKVLGLFDVS